MRIVLVDPSRTTRLIVTRRLEARGHEVGPAPGVDRSGEAEPGVVVRAFGKFFTVILEDGRELLSTVRGGLKRQRRGTDLVAVGDRVMVSDVGEGEGRIEAVSPRTRALSRRARHTRDVEQVILANPDQALFLFAVRDPEPHPRLLDRFLVMAESRGLPSIIGVNKMDLDEPTAGNSSLAHDIFRPYRGLYPVYFLSARTGYGLDQLTEALQGKITAVAGPSGVGKSSLLNVLDPSRTRAVGDISAATGKGRHTTTATVLHRLPESARWRAPVQARTAPARAFRKVSRRPALNWFPSALQEPRWRFRLDAWPPSWVW